MSATPARSPLGRAARKRSVRIIAAGAAIGVATTAIISVGGPAAGAATPLAQSVGRFLDGTVGGNPIQSLVDLADARAKAAPDSEQRNPLDVTALNAIKIPLTGALQLPGGGVFTLGAVNQVAVAKTTGAAYGASGAVANSGGVSLGGSSAFPANATVDLSSAALGSVPIPTLPGGTPLPDATALGGVQAQIGAVSALAQTAAGGAFKAPQYQLASLKLVLGSPALGALLQQLAAGGTQLTTLLGTLGTALPVGGTLPASCSLTSGTVPTTITLDQGAVVIDPATATLTVDLGKLLSVLGLNINSLPANTDLLAYLLNNLGDILSTGLEGVINGITGPLKALGDTCLPALGAIGGIIGGILNTLTSGQAALETAVNSIASSLATAGAPGLKTLTDQLAGLLAIGVNVQQGAFPLAGAAKPDFAFTSQLAATPDQATPVVSGQGVVRAIEIDLLGGQAASLALASAAAGPSSAVVAPTTSAPAPPTTSAPNTQIPTGVPAGAAGHGDTTPTLPLVLLLLGLVLAGGGATFYRTRGKFGR